MNSRNVMDKYLLLVLGALLFSTACICDENVQNVEDSSAPIRINNEEELIEPLTIVDIPKRDDALSKPADKESSEFGPDTPEFWVSENESSDSRIDLAVRSDSQENQDDPKEGSALTSNDNATEKNSTEIIVRNLSDKNSTEAKLRCVLKVLSEGEEAKIHILNTTALLKALTPVPNVTSGECALVMFYSPWCPYSAKAAPHFNALPRLYPHFSFYALDAVSYNSLNMRYGLVALPSVLLFHNGKGIVKFNESEPVLDKLVHFIKKYTGTAPHGNVTIQEDDLIGPISSVALEKTDYLLILSWLFTITCAGGWFMKSSLFQHIVESVRNAWREAEAQHEHQE